MDFRKLFKEKVKHAAACFHYSGLCFLQIQSMRLVFLYFLSYKGTHFFFGGETLLIIDDK